MVWYELFYSFCIAGSICGERKRRKVEDEKDGGENRKKAKNGLGGFFLRKKHAERNGI